MLLKLLIVIISIILSFLPIQNAFAECQNTFMNPITDINWQGIFPIKLGSLTLIDTDIDTPASDTSSPVCICDKTIGLKAEFWEPARLVETVKDPYCFPSIGVQMSNPKEGFMGGGYSEGTSNDINPSTFQQAHWYIFPVWGLLDLFLDFPCLEKQSFDIAYMTEIDPLWNDDLLSFLLNPEALLFGNPVAQLACMADSVDANAGISKSPLFWCMGSWGSTYPLTGHINSDNYIQANAALAARMIFKLGREALLFDTGVDECGVVPSPIWNKENYRMHISKPVRDDTVHPLGRSSLIWGSMKNPPFGADGNSGDNMLWVIFRKVLCCIGYTF